MKTVEKEVSSRSRSFYQPREITLIIKPRGLQYHDPYSTDIILGPANGAKQPRALINAALLATLPQ